MPIGPEHPERATAPAEADQGAVPAEEPGDTSLLEGITSDQVMRAREESRAEGEPYEDAE
ncbi:hypothetical protein ACFYNO_09875 [Kitasatospora sp. NPDC006697]|uniref:hypothetical protein n=1 Tax=Kitasatospora sp. NPDC006697 TaxID=3364020 RepID=UPI0036952E38